MLITNTVPHKPSSMCDIFKIMANRKEETNGVYVEHKITHYQQRYNWDCGVTCVLMLLDAEQQKEFIDTFHDICAEEGFNQSTWTIDLCYLLKRFDIKHHMYTTMAGVSEQHRRHDYYNKIIDIDRERVRRRFATAAARGVRVGTEALSLARLLQHVRARGPALLLVDAALLPCDLCKRNQLRTELRQWFGGSYSGHYICVVGVRGGRLLFRDPALPPRLCAAAPRRLQRARAAPGTDHDVILVYKDFR